MAIVHIACPICKHQVVFEERNLDTSKQISCAACGYVGLPIVSESPKNRENKSWEVVKIIIIILAGIAFALVGLSVIALAAFFVPIMIVAVVVILWYQRRKEIKSYTTDIDIGRSTQKMFLPI